MNDTPHRLDKPTTAVLGEADAGRSASVSPEERHSPKPPSEGDGTFDPVWQGYDATQGQMLEELLRQEGFCPRLVGSRSASLLGAGEYIMALRIEVPLETVEEARSVLSQFLDGEAVQEDTLDEAAGEGLDQELRGDDDERTISSSPRKMALLAAGLPFVCFGLGQLYAGWRWTGLLLMVNVGGLLVWTSRGHTVTACYLALALTIAVDVVMGQVAVRRTNAGKPAAIQPQLLYGIAEGLLIQLFFFLVDAVLEGVAL